MFLLLQIDAPLVDDLDRVIYVFACNTRLCTEGPLKDALDGPFKVVVQSRSTKAAPQTPKKTFFDDLMLDVKDTTVDSHDSLVLGIQGVHISPKSDEYLKFPATKLRIVDELISRAQRLGRENGQAKKEGIDGQHPYKVEEASPEEGYESMEVAGYDKYFKAFHMRVSHYPRQCVRYAPGTRPLLFSAAEPSDSLVCDCQGHPNPMQFDLQLMPAILSILPTNEERHLAHIPTNQRNTHSLFGDGMEWGTVLVYTCHLCHTKGGVRVHTESS